MDSIITDVNNYGTKKYAFRYDSTGHLSERIEYIEKDRRWSDPEKRIYTYDDKGRISFVSIVPPQSKSDFGLFREEYTYDTRGNLLSVIFTAKEGEDGEWKEKSLREFRYNEEGFLVKRTDYDYREGERREKFMSEKEYNRKGRMRASYEYEYYEGEKKPWRKYCYSYNKKGLLSKKDEYAPNGKNAWRRRRTEERNYDKSGRISFLSIRKGNKRCGNTIEEEYHYDIRGNLTQIIGRFRSGGVVEYEKRTSFVCIPDTPVSSVMGLNCSEVLSTDWALRENLNLTSQPLSVTVEEGSQRSQPEKTQYYYSTLVR
ncbi:MAG: hypothetical protein IJ693_00475 [Bacteroidaceae bacterium]|nr:hypothetical protein [Bacteroidaceae bacterium]